MSNTNRVIRVINYHEVNLPIISLQLSQRKRFYFVVIYRLVENKLVFFFLIGVELRAVGFLFGRSKFAIFQPELAAIISTIWPGGAVRTRKAILSGLTRETKARRLLTLLCNS